MRKITKFILITILLNPLWTEACSCFPQLKFDGSDYLDYTDVFKGKVSNLSFKGNIWDTTDTANFNLYEFVVEKTYKGVQQDTILLKLSLSNGVNCTKKMEVSESWYIFANLLDSAYYVGGCSWSHQVSYRPDLMKQAINYVSELSFISDKKVKLPFLDSDCNCQRFYSGTIVNGQADGVWKTLDSLGGVIEKGLYSNGEKVGLWEFYFQDSNNLALPHVSGKRYYQGKNIAIISYGWDRKINYSYKDDNVEIPQGIFTKEELEAIEKTKANRVDGSAQN